MTDDILYRRYLGGDEDSLSALMERHGDKLTLYLDGCLHDLHESEDPDDRSVRLPDRQTAPHPRRRLSSIPLPIRAAAYGFCAALREYYRARRRPWFLLTCFYATFALGTLYWTLHLLLRQETPQVFYVSDLAWLASFATFENVCYLTQNGAGQFVYLLIRGFGTGAMHIVCGSVYGRVLRPVWGSRPLRAACLFGLLCVAIIYHAIYNLLVSVGGTAQLLAYAIPLLTALCFRLLGQQTAAQKQ